MVSNSSFCRLQEKYIVVTGGTNRDFIDALCSAGRYDCQNDMWEQIASLNEARMDHSSCSIGDSVYIFDGDSEVNHQIEKLDKVTGPVKETSKHWQSIKIGITIDCKKIVTAVLNSQEIIIFGAIKDKVLILNSKTNRIDVEEDKDKNIYCYPS